MSRVLPAFPPTDPVTPGRWTRCCQLREGLGVEASEGRAPISDLLAREGRDVTENIPTKTQ